MQTITSQNTHPFQIHSRATAVKLGPNPSPIKTTYHVHHPPSHLITDLTQWELCRDQTTSLGKPLLLRPHICHRYHRLYLWRKICHVEKFQISVKNLNNLWSVIVIYAVFVLNLCGENLCGEKLTNMRSATPLPHCWSKPHLTSDNESYADHIYMSWTGSPPDLWKSCGSGLALKTWLQPCRTATSDVHPWLSYRYIYGFDTGLSLTWCKSRQILILRQNSVC